MKPRDFREDGMPDVSTGGEPSLCERASKSSADVPERHPIGHQGLGYLPGRNIVRKWLYL
jgi:hypothetical protein